VKRRIVVLALNPSIDAEWRVDDVRWEEKNDVLADRRWPGGKGVNVARWLRRSGEDPLLILPLGGVSGREVSAGLKRERISARVIPIQDDTRTNVIVTTRRCRQLRFNPRGPALSAAEWHAVFSAVLLALPRARCLVLSGSLPRGVPRDAYARIIREANACGVPALLDCDGAALVAGLRARPFLAKPNEHELLAWAQVSNSGREVQSAARAMSARIGSWVFVTRGPGTAFLVNDVLNRQLKKTPRRVKPRNTVGAGDALLAAVARQVARGAAPAAWLRAGLAAGSAATRLTPGV
jgi:1-phosphofructokinase family hexose kinase